MNIASNELPWPLKQVIPLEQLTEKLLWQKIADILTIFNQSQH